MRRTHRLFALSQVGGGVVAGRPGVWRPSASCAGSGPGGHGPHRTPVLHPNPQSIFDSLRYAYVNVGSGKLTLRDDE